MTVIDGLGPYPTRAVFDTMPGFVLRRLYQAYLGVWLRYIDPVVSGPQYAVLSAVEHYPGAEQGQLAAVAALEPSTMAGIVARLEERGLIARMRADGDRRKRLLRLTESGEATLADVRSRVAQLDALLLQGLDEVAVSSLLGRLSERSDHWAALLDTEVTARTGRAEA